MISQNNPSHSQQPAQENQEPVEPLKIGSVLFISFQYFQQGIMGFLSQSLILTYPHVPSYKVLSIFQGVKIPWALKFIFAPFLQIYTLVFYGKRKFWMILSGLIMAIFILILSFFTTENYQIVAAIILIVAAIFSSTSDIATDGCSVKDLRNPEQISFIQTSARRIGSIIGGFVFSKLVLPTFGKWIGLPGSVTSVSVFLKIIAVFFIVSEIAGHFIYKEQVLEEEIDRKNDDLWETIKQYKVFFQSKKKYFRTGLLLMLSAQGLLFFSSSYQYQLMKKGFSKQRINQIVTAASLPIIVIIYFFSKLASQQNMYKLLGTIITLRYLNYIIAYIFQPSTTIPVITYIFIDQTLVTLYDVTGTIIVNYFPVTAVSGMMITMLNSWKNTGNFASLHLLVVGAIGHRVASLIGFVVQGVFMVFVFGKMVTWVKEGEVDGEVEGIQQDDTFKRQTGLVDHQEQFKHSNVKSDYDKPKKSTGFQPMKSVHY